MTVLERNMSLKEQAMLVVRLLDQLGVLDADARGRALAARPLAAAVLDGFDELCRSSQPDAVAGAREPEQHAMSRAELYAALVGRIRTQLLAHVPEDARVAVISRGDSDLTDLPGRHGSHFPQDHSGGWAGHYPANGGDAVAHVECLRARGVRWLAIPSPAAWWLQYYGELRDHLVAIGRCVIDNEDLGLWSLASPQSPQHTPQVQPSPLAQLVRALVPSNADVLVITPPDHAALPAGLDSLSIGFATAIATNARETIDAHASRPNAFVVIPDHGENWLTEYPQLWQHLASNHALIADRTALGSVFELIPSTSHFAQGTLSA